MSPAIRMSTTVTDNLAPAAPQSFVDRLSLFAADIKLSHTIFAMPFALLSTFLAANGWPHPGQLALIVACMITARTVAMAANRYFDAAIDAKNPRTARRAIPSGKLSRTFVLSVLLACTAAFVLCTSGFGFIYHNWLPLLFAVPVLVYLSAYPFLKRFTQWCHYYLGTALAAAPVCAWIAIRGSIDWPPLLMAAAVVCWTAGFDIIYACQDFESDRAEGIFSVPARFGIGRALWIARFTHVLSVVALVTLGLQSEALSILYFIGVWIAAGLLVVEHLLVSPTDLSKVGLAFFTINGIISVLLGVLGILDVFM